MLLYFDYDLQYSAIVKQISGFQKILLFTFYIAKNKINNNNKQKTKEKKLINFHRHCIKFFSILP